MSIILSTFGFSNTRSAAQAIGRSPVPLSRENTVRRRVLRVRNQKPLVKCDGGIVGEHVQEGRRALLVKLADEPSDEKRGVAFAAILWTNADRADLNRAIEPHALASHGGERAIDPNANVLTKLVRARTKRAGLESPVRRSISGTSLAPRTIGAGPLRSGGVTPSATICRIGASRTISRPGKGLSLSTVTKATRPSCGMRAHRAANASGDSSPSPRRRAMSDGKRSATAPPSANCGRRL